MKNLTDYYYKYFFLDYVSKNIKTKRRPKYSNEYVFDQIIKVNKNGTCWNALECVCHFTTIYKRFIYWSTNNIFEKVYKLIRDEYLQKQKHYIYKHMYIDTMAIKNWKGIDCIGRSKKYKFKNATNISFISDNNKMPVGIHVISGNTHDANTITDTLDSINFGILDKRLKIKLMADKGYIKNKKYKKYLYDVYNIKLISHHRKNMIPNTRHEKLLLKKRCKVEHLNASVLHHNRIHIRFDKYVRNYKSFIFLTCASMIAKFL